MRARRARSDMAKYLAAILLISSAMPSMARAESQPVEDAFLRAGASSFRAYCANCHGETGTGDGPVSGYLKIAPADLTRLSEKQGGKFPTEKVFRSIDGREQVRLHGARDMPIWGEAFVRPGAEPDAKVRQRIDALIAYLRSIQK